MSESPAGRSLSGAFHQPAAPRPAEARPSTEATAPPAGVNMEWVEPGLGKLGAALISTHKEETGSFHRRRLRKLEGNNTWKTDILIYLKQTPQDKCYRDAFCLHKPPKLTGVKQGFKIDAVWRVQIRFPLKNLQEERRNEA